MHDVEDTVIVSGDFNARCVRVENGELWIN